MACHCSECTYLKDSGSWPDISGNFWCNKKGEKIRANDIACSRFCRCSSRSSSSAKKLYDYSMSHSSNVKCGCYITTVICEILGLDDNCDYMQVLRHFRNNYLQKNPNTLGLLVEYDVIGPVIADHLRHDAKKEEIACNLMHQYIIPCVMEISDEKYGDATITYSSMTKNLIERYAIDGKLPEVTFDPNEDYSEYGHGRIAFTI